MRSAAGGRSLVKPEATQSKNSCMTCSLLLPDTAKARKKAEIKPMSDCQKYFSRERMPSGSFKTTLRQSSTQPMAPKPRVTIITTHTKRLDQSNQRNVDRAMDSRISAPPMVGVPRLARCSWMPYSRMGWPILSSVSLRMTMGPRIRPMITAVMAAITARKVRYWKTRRKPRLGSRLCSHMARLSSMCTPLKRGHDDFHLHESRTFDEHGGHLGRSALNIRQGRDHLGR